LGLGRIFLPRSGPGDRTTQAGGRELSKPREVNRTQDTAAAAATANPEPSGSGSDEQRGRHASCIAHGAGAGATARPESSITQRAAKWLVYAGPVSARRQGGGAQHLCLQYVCTPEVLRTKHKTRAGGRECRCRQTHKNTGRWGGCKTMLVRFPGPPRGKKMRPCLLLPVGSCR
jgi:hypothetical protein